MGKMDYVRGMFLRCFFFFCLVGVWAGCGLFGLGGKKEVERTEEDGAQPSATTSPTPVLAQVYLGTVSMVNEVGHFVLVDFGGFAAPTPGVELEVKRGSEVVAMLKAGAEMRRPFAAADILTGTPQPGDDVWSKRP